jgi:phage terminase large subunit-like protein
MANWRRLRARLEQLEQQQAARRLDASPWDWYGEGCPCGLPIGECRRHPRARANQRPPSGDWRTWLLLMGRGAGKTRAAAEWVRRRIESGACRRMALVGATAADVRDTMVDGQSGLLAISPPWFRPRYEPTRRRLTWPNGARATTFTADEPDRLRGPEHDGAWCLAGETRVLMADGSEKPIAAVRAGEMVATPIGPRRVLASALTGRDAEVNRVDIAGGRSIIGTGDHPIRMATGEFVPIRSLTPGMFALSAVRCPLPVVGPSVPRGPAQIASADHGPRTTAHGLNAARIVSVEKLATRIDVYDLAVEGARQYFANGILVHNCDEVAAWRYPEAMDNLLFGLRLGDDPRLCATTTPKPVRLVVDLLNDPTTAVARGTTYDNRTHLAASFFDRVVGKYEGTRLGQQELMAEVLEISDGVWFHRFDPSKHVSEEARYDPRWPVHLAIDCGLSRHVAAVWFQVRGVEPSRRVTVFGEFHAEGLYSEAAAKAILAHAWDLPSGSRIDTVRLDPASTARSGVGPAAYAEFERVFGSRMLSRWPLHRVAEGLDLLDLLMDKGLLLIHPSCTMLRAAFQNYVRKRTGRGDWLDEPADPQHPHEDLMDALRGGVRDRFPEGRAEQPRLHHVHAGRIA